MTDKSVHDATEEWVRHSITKEFAPIDINDVYKAFAAGAQWQSQQAQGEPELATTCPECHGLGWDMDCQDELRPSTCPDCAGSGKAEHSITVQESDSAVPEFDKKLFDSECRESVAGALGFPRGGDYAWSYLLAQIKEAVAATAMLTASPAPEHIPDAGKMVSPAVQGEPVAVMYENGSLLSKADCGDNFEICCKVQTPLYAAPQPDVAQLVEALHEGRRAIGDHYVPDDCYATGPVTGDPFRDLVQCPACSFIAAYDDVFAAYRKQGGEA